MIKADFYTERKDGVKLYRTYSDRNMMIQKDGTDETYADRFQIKGA